MTSGLHMNTNLLVALLPLVAGCAYLNDRVRDASDMVTAAVEAPTVNAAVQVGPLMAGLGAAGGGGFGLRSGGIGVYHTEETNFFTLGHRLFAPRDLDQYRDKGYEVECFWFPGLRSNSKGISESRSEEGQWFNACQFEATFGLGVGVRAGVNVAEILDFILGWTTLDICGDDIAAEERREAKALEESKKADNP